MQIHRKLGPWILVLNEITVFVEVLSKYEWWEIGLIYISGNQV